MGRVQLGVFVLGIALVVAACTISGPREPDSSATAALSGLQPSPTLPLAINSGTPPTPTPRPTPSPTPSPTPTPTPSPTPTPTPPPPPQAHCYQPRQILASAPAATPGIGVGTPSASPAEQAPPQPVLRPAGPKSVFQDCQVIAYYGYPGNDQMGILGTADPDTIVKKLEAQAAEYDKVNGSRGVAPALELIYAVAQGSQTADGTYLARMPDDLMQQYLAVADKYDLLVVLDIQMGSSNVEKEFPHVLPYLKNPRVHLALDPEFVVPDPHTPPGRVIGNMDVSEINKAEQLLQQLVEQEHLPNKILVVHQFIPDMILNKGAMQTQPNVDLVIDQDGFGGAALKSANYHQFVDLDNAPHGGMKLFYTQDTDLMTPEQVEQLDPQPDYIVYQ